MNEEIYRKFALKNVGKIDFDEETEIDMESFK